MTDSSSSAKLTIKSGPDAGKVIDLGKGVIFIGRTAPAELILANPEISRRHARLEFKDGRYILDDLGSSNGTFLNGKRIQGPQPLTDGAEIRFGSQVALLFSQPELRGATVVQTSASGVQSLRNDMADQTLIESASASRTSLTETPPTLQITITGQETKSYTLNKERFTLGRADDNDIVVASPIVSRHHAALERTENGFEIQIAPGAVNTLSCQGSPVKDRRLLSHNDVLRIDSDLPGMMVTMTYISPAQAVTPLNAFQFGDKEKLSFGRDPANDVVCDDPRVSRFHAQVTRVGRRYFVTDLRSANGTFVNDKRVSGNVWLNPRDTIRVGPYKLVMGEDQFTRYDETQGLRVDAYHLNKWVRKDLNLLQDISLVYQPREFICVVGQSGGGKSTLLDAIAGYRPATQGRVFVNGIDVYQDFDAVRNDIGYVPQKDIIHMELTVYQALNFAAQLRMPKDTTAEERHKRIMEVLTDLDLLHRKDVQVSGLSGGQQKRVSIGVELLTRPGLFFLDEPTSGLDPGTETAFMHLMRRLADQGRTIVMVTHATKNVMLADKVVFLARGGYVAWFGPPDEALAFFDQYRSDQDRRARDMEFDQIYAILDDPTKGKGKDWGERYMNSPFFAKYVVQPLSTSKEQTAAVQGQQIRKQARKGARTSSLRQFMVLSARNITILLRDRSALTLSLAVPVGVGLLQIILAFAMGHNIFVYKGGSPSDAGTVLFLLSLDVLLVGGMATMREFVKEADIYRRERLVNLRIFPYVASKIWIAFVLAFWHALAYTALQYIAFKMPGGVIDFFEIYVTLWLACVTGMMLGLLASALSPNAASAPLTLIMMMIPLIVLSGALAPIPTSISQIASTRWTFQGMVGITGMGTDVAADPCWHLPKDLRDFIDLDTATYFQCKCMGLQSLNEKSCNFPGLGKYYVAEIDQPAPVEPPPLPPQPPEPVMPTAPQPPSNKYDQVQTVQYLNALISYQNDAQNIQDNYRNQMDLYQVQADVYKSQMIKYQEDLAKYNVARISAVNGAQGTIQGISDAYGWAFVDKSNPVVYLAWLIQDWTAPLIIVVVYFVVILYLIKRKDVK